MPEAHSPSASAIRGAAALFYWLASLGVAGAYLLTLTLYKFTLAEAVLAFCTGALVLSSLSLLGYLAPLILLLPPKPQSTRAVYGLSAAFGAVCTVLAILCIALGSEVFGANWLLAFIVVPILGSAAFNSLLLGIARRRGWIRPHAPYPTCAECGYNLTGNVSGACPECGSAARPQGTAAGSPPLGKQQ